MWTGLTGAARGSHLLHRTALRQLLWTVRSWAGDDPDWGRGWFYVDRRSAKTLARVLPAIMVAALLCAVALVPLAHGDPPSQGCDLVASTLGSDSAPGTLTQPVRTVQKLADTLAPGQTGCLRGTAAALPFSENVTVANKNSGSSTEADRIRIRNFPSEIPKLQGRLVIADSGNRITGSGLALDGRDAVDANSTAPSPQIDGDDVKVVDSNLTGGDQTGCLQLGSGPTAIAYRTRVERLRVHD